MNYESYQKLKDEVKSKDFHNNYRGLSKFTYYTSFVANFFSILFAYFHASKIINQAITEPTPTTAIITIIVCILVLTGLEFFKRFIFDKFSLELIRQKFKLKGSEIGILGFISVLLITASFYLSLNGAKEYAAKSDEIKDKTEITVQSYEDSITVLYDKKIQVLDSTNLELSKQKSDYDQRAEEAIYRRDKTYYRDQIKELQVLIDKNDLKIKELKRERDDLIAKNTNKIQNKADETLKNNEGNSVKFLIFSTIIEILIIIGVFFHNFFSHKSVQEYEEKMNKDPRYKTFHNYNQLLDVLYKQGSKVNDNIPFKTEISKILKINQVDLVGKDLDDAMKVFTHLGIIQQRGPKRILKTDKDSAKIIIKEHLKID